MPGIQDVAVSLWLVRAEVRRGEAEAADFERVADALDTRRVGVRDVVRRVVVFAPEATRDVRVVRRAGDVAPSPASPPAAERRARPVPREAAAAARSDSGVRWPTTSGVPSCAPRTTAPHL